MSGSAAIFKSKSFISLIGNGISAALGVLSFAILARMLPDDKHDFGVWILFLSVYGVFDTLRVGMILNAMVRNVSQAGSVERENEIVGSSLRLSVILTVLFILLIGLAYAGFFITSSLLAYLYLFKWLALMALLTLPHNFSTWYLNAHLRIMPMSLIRIINQALFIALAIPMYRMHTALESIFGAYALAQLFTSVFCIIKGWSGMSIITKATRVGVKEIFDFGKYSMGTLIGSNFLKNSDTWLISRFIDAVAVAVYSVPTKVVEIIELPVRSFAVTNLPLLSKLHGENKPELLKKEFERKTGFIFIMLLPVSVMCFILAPFIVTVLGGEAYSDSVILLRLFTLYTALTPLDKMTGVMLDIINKPQMNFVKVIVMLVVNVIGDVVCLFVFGTLESVAIVSTFTFGTGMIFGFVLLKKYINLSLRNTLALGINECKVKFNALTNRT